jgi:aryl-alcohol dehydrogenase-like predicted oxidoreductase
MQRDSVHLPQSVFPPLEQGDVPLPWLWIGTWSMGGAGFGQSSLGESLNVLDKAYRSGVRHFDTAGFYARGRSEELLAKAFKSTRKSVFISTKGGLVWNGNKVLHQGSPQNLRQSLMDSLKRLQTDYLDLFQLHWPDPAVPLTESVEALKELQQEGLTRFWGVGNLTTDEIESTIEKNAGIPHQVHHNPIHRSDVILNTGKTDTRCVNCITSPLEQGLLAGGRSAEGLGALGKKDVRRRNPHFHSDKTATWLSQFRSLADASPMSRVSLVLLWLLTMKTVDVVIPGPRTVSQLEEILTCQKWLETLGGMDERHPARLADNLADALGTELWTLLASHN